MRDVAHRPIKDQPYRPRRFVLVRLKLSEDRCRDKSAAGKTMSHSTVASVAMRNTLRRISCYSQSDFVAQSTCLFQVCPFLRANEFGFRAQSLCSCPTDCGSGMLAH
jgi:hypothetical protein